MKYIMRLVLVPLCPVLVMLMCLANMIGYKPLFDFIDDLYDWD